MAVRLGQLADSSHHAALIDNCHFSGGVAGLSGRPADSFADGSGAQAQWIAHSHSVRRSAGSVSRRSAAVLFQVTRTPPAYRHDSAAAL